jgi:hypothetical protein
MKISDKERLAFLKDEYLLLQGQYEDFDRRSITIKGWVTGGSILGFGTAFAQGQQLVSISILAIIALLSAVVWYLEATWKQFQYAFQQRIITIEAFFRGDDDFFRVHPNLANPPEPFQIFKSWMQSHRTDNLRWVGLQRFVQLPYSVITLISALASFLKLVC